MTNRLTNKKFNISKGYDSGKSMKPEEEKNFTNKVKRKEVIRFIDLFAGMGGIRIGFEQACLDSEMECECVFTSEIKKHAVDALKINFPGETIHGDITEIDASDIPDFDVLLAGFPCQSFSFAGKGLGFLDTRGTLFFEIERILTAKKPKAFILENVEGLVTHDKEFKYDQIGKTLKVILNVLEKLGYKTSWKVLDSAEFGVAQSRKRIYIVGSKDKSISMDFFEVNRVTF